MIKPGRSERSICIIRWEWKWERERNGRCKVRYDSPWHGNM